MLSFRVKLSLLVVVLLPILVSLGIWQLSRYQDKLKLEQVYEYRRQLPSLNFSEVLAYKDPLYLPLTVSGRFDPERYFLLDNQIYQGKPGYGLLMPFITDKGEWLLVDRGWLPLVDRDTFPEISTPAGQQTITGNVYRSFGQSFLLTDDLWQIHWPKRIQSLDFNRVQATLGRNIPAMTLVLNENQPGAEQFRPISLNMKSAKHLGYAIQWFAMALVLVGLYIYRLRRSFQVRQPMA